MKRKNDKRSYNIAKIIFEIKKPPFKTFLKNICGSDSVRTKGKKRIKHLNNELKKKIATDRFSLIHASIPY